MPAPHPGASLGGNFAGMPTHSVHLWCGLRRAMSMWQRSSALPSPDAGAADRSPVLVGRQPRGHSSYRGVDHDDVGNRLHAGESSSMKGHQLTEDLCFRHARAMIMEMRYQIYAPVHAITSMKVLHSEFKSCSRRRLRS